MEIGIIGISTMVPMGFWCNLFVGSDHSFPGKAISMPPPTGSYGKARTVPLARLAHY